MRWACGAISAAPTAVRDFYVWIKGSFVWMEVAAIVAAVIALWRYPYPFIVLIIAFALWFMSMDLTPWIVGRTDFTWDERRIVSLWFGLAVLVVAYIVDRRERGGDFAFWLHLFGLMAFWGGLSLTNSGSEVGKFLYFVINVGLLLMSVLLGRRVYAVFGTLGIAGYLGHLSYKVFRELDDVPVRAVADRHRRDRARAALSPQAGGDRGLDRGQHPRGGAPAAARARAVIRDRCTLIDKTLSAASASRTPHSV